MATVNSENLYKAVLSCLLAVVGWFLVTSFNRTSQRLSEISKDIISLKLDIQQLRSSMLTQDRVKDLIQSELLKHDLKK